MCDQRLWQNVSPLLSKDQTPVYIQFGQHHTIERMLDDITPCLDLDPVDLVGFSMGGYLALQYALEHPGAIRRLVIIGATGTCLSEDEQKKRENIRKYVESRHYDGITKQRLKMFVHPNNICGPLIGIIQQMDKSLGRETLLAQLTATRLRPSLLEKVKALDIPVLIVGAEQDQLVKVDEIFTLAENFPNATVKLIKDSGHMSPLEAPVQLAQIIEQFLADSD
jgi:pimeloyl-ACP methyl ester carboxylesterase